MRGMLNIGLGDSEPNSEVSLLGLLYHNTIVWGLINNRNLFLTISEPGESKIKVPADSASGSRFLLVHSLPSSHCVFTW